MVEPTTTVSEAVVERHAPRYSDSVLQYFRTHGDAAATVGTLAAYASAADGKPERQVAVRLHHVTLPKLADAGLIDYDPRSNTARYRADGHEEHGTDEHGEYGTRESAE